MTLAPEMSPKKQAVHVSVLIVILFVAYVGSWKFFFRGWAGRMTNSDPFAPQSSSVVLKAVDNIYAPISQFEWSKHRREMSEAAKLSMQGPWKGPVYLDGKIVVLEVIVTESTITFVTAPEWVELDGMTFQIVEDHGEWIPYFETSLGRIHIQAPSEIASSGGSPDEMYLRTTGFLSPSQEDVKVHRIKQEI